MLHGMALYLVTLHYIAENGNPDSRRLTISAEIEAEAVARAREQFSRLSPPPRRIIGATAIHMKEPAR
jgi:hypothetical protein